MKRFDFRQLGEMLVILAGSVLAYYGLFKLAVWLRPISRLWP